MTDPATSSNTPPTGYALGHTPAELERLASQARLIDPITRRFFRAAGLQPGMRVLDIGSGAGDVAILAAEIVGPTGSVVGTDPAPAAIATARARVAALGIDTVSFREGFPSEMEFAEPFDAIIGRYVLQFIPEPASVLRKLVRNLRKGGIVVFHEADLAGGRTLPTVPSHDECYRLIVETLPKLGAETRMGVKLHALYVAAGLAAPALHLESFVGGPGDEPQWYLMPNVARTLAPAMERLGLATVAHVESLITRMPGEIAAGSSVVVGRGEIGAWTQV